MVPLLELTLTMAVTWEYGADILVVIDILTTAVSGWHLVEIVDVKHGK